VDPKLPPGPEPLDLQIIIDLVELEGIDPGFEPASLWNNPKEFRVVARSVAGAETTPDYVIRHLFEALACLAGKLLQPMCQIVIKSERRSHKDIMMSQSYDVKMPSRVAINEDGRGKRVTGSKSFRIGISCVACAARASSDCYNELVNIPQNIERLLWEYDLDGLDLTSELTDTICGRVMAHGCWAEMQWLISVVGPENLRSYLEKRGAHELPPREVAFWGLACSVPDRLVQQWVGAARARQREWRG